MAYEDWHNCEAGHWHKAPDPAPIYQAEIGLVDAYIVDIDGTVALRKPINQGSTIRCPYGTDLVDTDAPNRGVIHVLKQITNPWTGPDIIFMTGRYEAARTDTGAWLERYFGPTGLTWPLLMREDGNQESDVDLKRRLYQTHVEGSFNILGVFDDREGVTKMWRKEFGLLVFQVAPGKF